MSSELPDFLQGPGEVRALLRARDWDHTAFGPVDAWSPALRAMVELVLDAPLPMWLGWGPQLEVIYNDALVGLLGSKHPAALGQRSLEIWSELRDELSPLIDRARAGESLVLENLACRVLLQGGLQDICVTHALTPVRDHAGRVLGLHGVVMDTTAAMRSDRSQRAEQARLQELFEQAPGFIATMHGPQHVFAFVNEALRRLFKRHDLVGKTVREGFPDLAGQGFYELLDQVYASGKRYVAHGVPARFRSAPGEPEDARWLDFIYAPLFDAAGNVTGVFCEGYDVTETYLAQQALHDREEHLRLATDAGEIGLWNIDVLTGERHWDPRMKSMFGMPPDARVSEADFYARVHPQDRDRIAAAIARSCDPNRRAPYDVEFRAIAQDNGRVLWISARGRAVFDASSRCQRLLGTSVEITARRAAEERLRELNETLERQVADALAQRKLLADVVESTDALIQVVDLELCWLAVNKASAEAFERLFGVRPRPGAAMLEAMRLQPEFRDRVEALWRRALAGERFTAVDQFQGLHFEMKFNPLLDTRGRVVGAYQFVYDVTERLRDEARLVEAERRLRQTQKIEALGQLTGGVAHDFNNLLMVIAGGVSLIERTTDPARRQRVLERMRLATERGSALTRQLLAFSRRQSLYPEAVDLRLQVDGMRELLERSLGGGVQLLTDLAGDLWPVQVDATELELVLLNLCVNARDAQPGGGTITIRARNHAQLAHGDLHGDFVELEVQDIGAGMTPEVLRRVFEPFFTTKAIGKGSGLGLAQVHGFAQQSGGNVEIDSAPGRGTTVRLLLPRADGQPPFIDDSARALARPDDKAGAVLLVEDNPDVAALTADMLAQLGYDVTTAGDAQDALTALGQHPELVLVFSDILMPGGMNGVGLAHEVRRRRPMLPVLLTSGYTGDASRTAEIEGFAVLPKPFDLESLDAALRLALHPAPPPTAV